VAGELEVTVADETRKLSTGESLRYHADRPHKILNTGKVPAHATMVLVEGFPQSELRR
jgi:mannose-6-phosphate isomerase-like protein (cupin superfamily)